MLASKLPAMSKFVLGLQHKQLLVKTCIHLALFSKANFILFP